MQSFFRKSFLRFLFAFAPLVAACSASSVSVDPQPIPADSPSPTGGSEGTTPPPGTEVPDAGMRDGGDAGREAGACAPLTGSCGGDAGACTTNLRTNHDH